MGDMSLFAAKSQLDVKAEEARMRDNLSYYGLDELRQDVCVLKFIYNLNMLDIAELLHIPSTGTAQYLLSSAIKRLREQGYE